jgi:hypothetical protein
MDEHFSKDRVLFISLITPAIKRDLVYGELVPLHKNLRIL